VAGALIADGPRHAGIALDVGEAGANRLRIGLALALHRLEEQANGIGGVGGLVDRFSTEGPAKRLDECMGLLAREVGAPTPAEEAPFQIHPLGGFYRAPRMGAEQGCRASRLVSLSRL